MESHKVALAVYLSAEGRERRQWSRPHEGFSGAGEGVCPGPQHVLVHHSQEMVEKGRA